MRGEPRAKRVGRLGHDLERHVRVLRAAVLRTLSAVDAGPVGLQPLVVGLAGNRLRFAGQLRNPECMDHVRAVQFDRDGLAHRDVDLVGGDERGAARVVGIADGPPPVVRGHDDRQRGRARRRRDHAEHAQHVHERAEQQHDRDRGADRHDRQPAALDTACVRAAAKYRDQQQRRDRDAHQHAQREQRPAEHEHRPRGGARRMCDVRERQRSGGPGGGFTEFADFAGRTRGRRRDEARDGSDARDTARLGERRNEQRDSLPDSTA
ncbi:hypothetical protein BamIOP4010DRAFT_6900 [Burkholderia ambifaria IOP40-10]|uniref:Uncharacterized protein n=1 Tax=Burkholderia ambifaria IOP40-10 TaxID=396596 RepID=B1FS87_9BURK|nr:hypothetical protein BamIOP4010DRAFT_6900 [Burkholderia ambifaria IOP40-10]